MRAATAAATSNGGHGSGFEEAWNETQTTGLSCHTAVDMISFLSYFQHLGMAKAFLRRQKSTYPHQYLDEENTRGTAIGPMACLHFLSEHSI